ncbi:hypothetical protein ACJ77P_14425 [Syntrophus buswellii]
MNNIADPGMMAVMRVAQGNFVVLRFDEPLPPERIEYTNMDLFAIKR